MDYKASEIVKLSFEDYQKHFNDQNFGINLAKEILKSLKIEQEVNRITEGSSLVFEVGSELFLKISPPYFGDSFDAEISASILFKKSVSFKYPELIETGKLENWDFLISKKVHGVQAYKVFRTLSDSEKLNLAIDLASVVSEISKIDYGKFKRDFGPWKKYLEERLINQYEIHVKKGNSEYWTNKIIDFVNKRKNLIRELGPPVMLHADINAEHVMLEQINGQWRFCALLDLADAMTGPAEIEFILPCLDFFRGNNILQKRFLDSAGYKTNLLPVEFSEMMLALILQNRFMAFHHWFSREIKNGLDNLEDLAKILFPY